MENVPPFSWPRKWLALGALTGAVGLHPCAGSAHNAGRRSWSRHAGKHRGRISQAQGEVVTTRLLGEIRATKPVGNYLRSASAMGGSLARQTTTRSEAEHLETSQGCAR
jgi:hypothetical protein